MRLLKITLFLFILTFAQMGFADKQTYYTIDEAAAYLHNKTGAQILAAETIESKQGTLYRFKVKKKGRVRVVIIRPDGTRARK